MRTRLRSRWRFMRRTVLIVRRFVQTLATMSIMLTLSACTQLKQLPKWKLKLVSFTEGNTLRTEVHPTRTSHNMSADGRFVVFATRGYGDGTTTQSYMRDTFTGDLVRIDEPTDTVAFASGSDLPVVDEHGTRVLFAALTPFSGGSGMTHAQVWRRDISSGVLGEPAMLTVNEFGVEGDGDSCYDTRHQAYWPGLALSANGSMVGIATYAWNLSDTVDLNDTLVYTRAVETAGNFLRMSETRDGVFATDRSFGPVLSATGAEIAFVSRAYNLPGGNSSPLVFKIYWRVTDDDAMSIRCLSCGRNGEGMVVPSDAPSLSPAISADGNYVSFASAASNLEVGTTRGDGSQYNIYIAENVDRSADSAPTFLAPTGVATTDVNAMDTPATDDLRSSVSEDGRFIAFASKCRLADIENHVTPCAAEAHQNIFLYDTSLDVFEQLTYGSDGDSYAPSMTPNANAISFVSEATDLLEGVSDENNGPDIYLLRWDS